jgi:uncharacterized membrane protein YidH (DUF202 family)
MTDGIASAIAGFIAAGTVVLLMWGTKRWGSGSRDMSRNEQDIEEAQYRRFKRWLREQPEEE